MVEIHTRLGIMTERETDMFVKSTPSNPDLECPLGMSYYSAGF